MSCEYKKCPLYLPCLEMLDESPSCATNNLKDAIKLVRRYGGDVLSEGYPREQFDNYLTITLAIEKNEC